MTKRVHDRAEPSSEVELPQRESKPLPSRPQKVNEAELRREVSSVFLSRAPLFQGHDRLTARISSKSTEPTDGGAQELHRIGPHVGGAAAEPGGKAFRGAT
jgi:hypothetical protein